MVHRPATGGLARGPDRLAVEEPVEVRLVGPGGQTTLGVTMRTPGHDMELVAGFLLSEGVVDEAGDIARIAYCGGPGTAADQRYNVVRATLRRSPRRAVGERRTVTSSACGVCGTSSIDALRQAGLPRLDPATRVPLDWACRLPDALRREQRSFSDTGSVHGAGLAPAGGPLLVVREDVGRHNAVDKVLGWALLQGRLPASDGVLVVSGRVSFEIVQKAARAGVCAVVAVSGATSLAVSLAEEVGMTLVGFARGRSCTVYAGAERLTSEVAAGAAPAEPLHAEEPAGAVPAERLSANGSDGTARAEEPPAGGSQTGTSPTGRMLAPR